MSNVTYVTEWMNKQTKPTNQTYFWLDTLSGIQI